MAELRRHGVGPGQRVHLSVVASKEGEAGAEAVPDYFGSFRSGRPWAATGPTGPLDGGARRPLGRGFGSDFISNV
jgi:hypothetical protein